jgi:hypothetical protein
MLNQLSPAFTSHDCGYHFYVYVHIVFPFEEKRIRAISYAADAFYRGICTQINHMPILSSQLMLT